MTKFYKKNSKKKNTNKTRRATIAKIVSQQISRNLENKSKQYYRTVLPLSAYNNTASILNNSIFPISPYPGFVQIDQGTGAGGRIGNSIKIKRAMLRFIICPREYNATTNALPQPVEVKMWIFHERANPTTVPILATKFLQNGSSDESLHSNMVDLLLPVNNDWYKLHASRTFKLGYSYYESIGSSSAQPFQASNDFKLNIKQNIDVTKYLIKNVKFNDNDSTPTTRGTFVVFTAVPANGNTADAVTIPAEVTYSVDIDYEDA